MRMNQQGCWFGAVTSLAYSVQITDIVNPMFHGICVVMYPWPEGNRVGELSAIKQGSQHPESSRINNKLICELPDRLVCWAVFIFNRNKKKGKNMKKAILVLPALLAACSSSFTKTNETFQQQFDAGQYAAAAETMAKNTVQKAEPDNIYLGGLQCGTGYLWANDTENRQMCFAATEAVITDQVEEDSGYTVKDYEKIMFKTYSAMGMMADKSEYANQEFKQAYDLQVQNVQASGSEIEDLRKEFDEKSAAVPGLPDLDSIVKAVNQEMAAADNAVLAMKDYVNPYTTYLNAIYDGVNGDTTNAENYLGRVKQFAPDNTFVKSDASAIKSGKQYVWVFFENGSVGEIQPRSLAPEILQAFNIQLTIPDVFPGSAAAKTLFVGANGETTETQFLANMDSVVKTDLDKYKTQNIISSVVFEVGKVAAAAGAGVGAGVMAHKNQETSDLWAIGGTLAVGAIMSMEKDWDLRSWTSLPHEVQVARIEMPENRQITVNNTTVEIPDDIKNAAVFVRMPTPTAELGVFVGKIN